MASPHFPITAVVLLTLVLMVTPTFTKTCKSKADDKVEYRMARSDVVAFGYPRRHHTDSQYPDKERYIVDFEVKCIFKGAPLREMIRIYNVGMEDAFCMKSKFPENVKVIAYLSKQDGKLVPTFHEQPGEEGYLDEVPAVCGVKVNYPEGYSAKNNNYVCPDEYPYEDDCMPLPKKHKTGPSNPSENEASYKPVTPSVTDSTENEAPFQPVKARGNNEPTSDKPEASDLGGTTPKNTAMSLKTYLIIPLICIIVCQKVLSFLF